LAILVGLVTYFVPFSLFFNIYFLKVFMHILKMKNKGNKLEEWLYT